MLAELFRIASHLVWYGTFAQDLGALSPVFYMFNDRERVFDIVEAICGGRMHPNWFRIGGVAQDLPQGWDRLVRDFLRLSSRRACDEYDTIVMRQPHLQGAHQGRRRLHARRSDRMGRDRPEPARLRLRLGLPQDSARTRATTSSSSTSRRRSTATATTARVVRVEEMRQSLRIIEQCVDHMPAGPVQVDHPLTTPPLKERTMHDIETLITHFLGVSWGPVIPPGEALRRHRGDQGQQRLLPDQRRQHDARTARAFARRRSRTCRCCRCCAAG